MKSRFTKPFSRPAFATRQAPEPTIPFIRFTFEKVEGAVFGDGLVQWNGGSFQIEAASQELRAAIERYRKAAEASADGQDSEDKPATLGAMFGGRIG